VALQAGVQDLNPGSGDGHEQSRLRGRSRMAGGSLPPMHIR
jgi:hypothetical protein